MLFVLPNQEVDTVVYTQLGAMSLMHLPISSMLTVTVPFTGVAEADTELAAELLACVEVKGRRTAAVCVAVSCNGVVLVEATANVLPGTCWSVVVAFTSSAVAGT